MAENVGIIKAFLQEPWSYITFGLLLALLWNTFDRNLAGMYFILLIVDAVYYLVSKMSPNSKLISFNSVSGNSVRAFLTALVAFGAFIGLGYFLLSLMPGGTLQSLWQLLKESAVGAVNPIWQDNRFVTFLVGSIIIPYIETKALIAVPLQFFGRVWNVDLKLSSLKVWVLFAVVVAVGVIFHWQAKGVSNSISLALTGLFWLVSCILIVRGENKMNQKETESAVYLHMINNGWALRSLIL
jgi:hypothetical protein